MKNPIEHPLNDEKVYDAIFDDPFELSIEDDPGGPEENPLQRVSYPKRAEPYEPNPVIRNFNAADDPDGPL
ncbi:hypothetical protein [Feifania hominis]|uniref:Uncharacterized protein n=1 Tax=Feifania hominis TaxID=2763660 RepID=A0A926DF42_9FIRM|nr:hypothetical protein [Feifania hominis]MBC8536649.1 hypothetical protein [Feifania hominis]